MSQKKEHRLPIKWEISKDIKTKYATHLIVQHSDKEFYLLFFEINRPIILENFEQEINEIKEINADCISKIVISPDIVPDVINTLKENYNSYLGKKDVK